MVIAEQLINEPLNAEQAAVINHEEGPLLVIAGPGL
jgi:superfamily I DNA/RNA helicase